MFDVSPSGAILFFGLVQAIGWAGGFFARFSLRSRYQTICHVFFMLALLLVGAYTSWAWMLGTKCWMLSSTTFLCMILLAVCDFDRASRPVTI
jgi:hypothetical protein